MRCSALLPRAMVLAAAWLAGCSGNERIPDGRGGNRLDNRHLRLDVEVAADLASYRIDASFAYATTGHPAEGFYFVFPGVESPTELGIRLDGEPVDAAILSREPHPLYSGKVFRMPAASGAGAEGEHTLTVAGPWLVNDEPYFARWGGWHPYLGDRGEPVPIEMKVTAPASLRIVASGRRAEESVAGGSRIGRWQTRNPQGWTFLAVGDYREETLVLDGTSFLLWIPAEQERLDPNALVEEPGRVLSYLEGELGETGIDTVGWVFFPGKEPTSFSIDGLLVGSSATAARVSDSPEYLRGFLAHELAHYWFGDLVQSHRKGARWLSEGFAEYWRYRYEDAVGADPLPWTFRNQMMLGRFGTERMPTLMEEARGAAEDLFYQKGSFVLYMLERRLGRDALDETIRAFVERYRGRSVEPSHFFSVASEVAGEELGWFARQWLERSRGPVLSIPHVRVTPAGQNPVYRVEAEIRQRDPTYRLDLPIVIHTEDGVRHRFVRTVENARHTFTFELGAKPERITLDPEGEIFKWFPAARLPVDFATFRSELLDSGRYYVEGPRAVGGADSEWSRIRRWVEDQFGAERATAERKAATHIILLGDRATRARRATAADLPAPEGPNTPGLRGERSGGSGSLVGRRRGDRARIRAADHPRRAFLLRRVPQRRRGGGTRHGPAPHLPRPLSPVGARCPPDPRRINRRRVSLRNAARRPSTPPALFGCGTRHRRSLPVSCRWPIHVPSADLPESCRGEVPPGRTAPTQCGDVPGT